MTDLQMELDNDSIILKNIQIINQDSIFLKKMDLQKRFIEVVARELQKEFDKKQLLEHSLRNLKIIGRKKKEYNISLFDQG